MKHIAIILLAVLPALVGLAQDADERPMRDDYCTNAAPTLTWYSLVAQTGDRCGIQTKELLTKDTLKIYGIAASQVTEADMEHSLTEHGPEPEAQRAEFCAQHSDTP